MKKLSETQIRVARNIFDQIKAAAENLNTAIAEGKTQVTGQDGFFTYDIKTATIGLQNAICRFADDYGDLLGIGNHLDEIIGRVSWETMPEVVEKLSAVRISL